DVRAFIQVFSIDFRYRQIMLSEMTGKLDECNVLFANIVENANGRLISGDEAEDFSARAAKFSLNGPYLLNGCVEMLFKQLLEDFHISNNTSHDLEDPAGVVQRCGSDCGYLSSDCGINTDILRN